MTEQREQCCGNCKSWVPLCKTRGFCSQIRWHSGQHEWCPKFEEHDQPDEEHDHD